MSFVQIVSMRTDHPEEFQRLEEGWKQATEGRRTLLRDAVYVDRHDPRHYVSVNEFASYESAMVNSTLPETSAMAAEAGRLVDGEPEFTDLELVAAFDARLDLAARMRASLECSEAPDTVYADDVELHCWFPQTVLELRGRDAVLEGLLAEAPGRSMERWEVATTESGFAAEYRYRTVGNQVAEMSLGLVLATVDAGRVTRCVLTCAGSWDRAAEAEILGAESVPS